MVGVLSFGNLEQALHAHGECAEEVVLGVTSGCVDQPTGDDTGGRPRTGLRFRHGGPRTAGGRRVWDSGLRAVATARRMVYRGAHGSAQPMRGASVCHRRLTARRRPSSIVRVAVSHRLPRRRTSASGATFPPIGPGKGESLDEQAVAQAPVAHGDGVGAELRHHRPHDAGAREDHLGPLGLQPDDPAALLGGRGAVALDLAVDLGAVEDGALNDLGIVGREPVT